MNSEEVISASHAPRDGAGLEVGRPAAAHRASLSVGNEQAEVEPTDHLAQPDGLSRTGAPIIEPWISVDDLALVLAVSTDWVYEKAAAGELPSYKFGGHRRFRVSEVEDWASKCGSGKITRAASEETRRR